MASKVVVKETVTAEWLPAMPPLRPASPPPGEPGLGAVTDAVADANVTVLGSAPGLSLGEQMTAIVNGLSLAAHHATAAQASNVVLLGASTVRAITTLFGGRPRRRARPVTP